MRRKKISYSKEKERKNGQNKKYGKRQNEKKIHCIFLCFYFAYQKISEKCSEFQADFYTRLEIYAKFEKKKYIKTKKKKKK